MKEKNKKKVLFILTIFLFMGSIAAVSADFSEILTSAKKYFLGEENFITGYQSASRTTNVSLTVAGASPVVEAIYSSGISIPAQSVTENGATQFTVSFLVTDVDGTGDLNDTTANVTIKRSGGYGATGDGNAGIGNMSTNTSCTALADVDVDTANYTCTTQIHYWFLAGGWNVTAFIKDNSSNAATNTSNFTLQETTAIVIGPLSITFASLQIGQANITSSNAPIVVNNTANDNIAASNVRVTGIDLIGETTTSRIIGGGNFSVDIDTGGSPPAECTAATQLVNGTATGIAGSVLAAGNRSASGFGLEQIYTCLRLVPSGLTAQTYSTLNGTAWTVSVI